MNQFLIAATDIRTNATLYGKVSPSGHTLTFRRGLHVEHTGDRLAGLNFDKADGTLLDGDSGASVLAHHTRRVEQQPTPWVRDLRLVLA